MAGAGHAADAAAIIATVEIPTRKPAQSVIVRFRHPASAPIKSVTVNGQPWTEFDAAKETVTLKSLSGTVAVKANYRYYREHQVI